jgi:hypothetical protein
LQEKPRKKNEKKQNSLNKVPFLFAVSFR